MFLSVAAGSLSVDCFFSFLKTVKEVIFPPARRQDFIFSGSPSLSYQQLASSGNEKFPPCPGAAVKEERERVRERERENSNSKTLILKDSSVRSMRERERGGEKSKRPSRCRDSDSGRRVSIRGEYHSDIMQKLRSDSVARMPPCLKLPIYSRPSRSFVWLAAAGKKNGETNETNMILYQES